MAKGQNTPLMDPATEQAVALLNKLSDMPPSTPADTVMVSMPMSRGMAKVLQQLMPLVASRVRPVPADVMVASLLRFVRHRLRERIYRRAQYAPGNSDAYPDAKTRRERAEAWTIDTAPDLTVEL